MSAPRPLPFRLSSLRLLAALFLVPAMLGWGAVRAAAQERVALVVGISTYPDGTIATPVNDASLVAEALRSAGFELIQGADLDEPGLRQAVRDFLDRVRRAGPDAAAVVYFAGRGAQFEGDNFLIPSGARLERAADVPIVGYRLSDIMRSLGEGGVRIVVLDAAYELPPLIEGEQLAPGLAGMEPARGQLLAQSTAPNLMLPVSAGPYGAYAKALVEMMRVPGLGLEETFAKIRLRVHEGTGGMQVPWHAADLGRTQFSFYDAREAVQVPPPPAPARRVISERPLRRMPPDEAYSVVIERDEIPLYQDYLTAFPDSPYAPRVTALLSVRREAVIWRQSRRRDSREAYWTYLQRYPDGFHAYDARRRLTRLSAPLLPPPQFEIYEYEDLPPPLPFVETIRPSVVVQEYYYLPPPPPPSVILLPPPPPDLIVLPPPPPPVSPGLLPVIAPLAAPTWARTPAPPPPPVVVQPVAAPQPAPPIQPRTAPVAVQPTAPGVQAPAPLRAPGAPPTPPAATAPTGPTPAPTPVPGAPQPLRAPGAPPAPPTATAPAAPQPSVTAPQPLRAPGAPPAATAPTRPQPPAASAPPAASPPAPRAPGSPAPRDPETTGATSAPRPGAIRPQGPAPASAPPASAPPAAATPQQLRPPGAPPAAAPRPEQQRAQPPRVQPRPEAGPPPSAPQLRAPATAAPRPEPARPAAPAPMRPREPEVTGSRAAPPIVAPRPEPPSAQPPRAQPPRPPPSAAAPRPEPQRAPPPAAAPPRLEAPRPAPPPAAPPPAAAAPRPAPPPAAAAPARPGGGGGLRPPCGQPGQPACP